MASLTAPAWPDAGGREIRVRVADGVAGWSAWDLGHLVGRVVRHARALGHDVTVPDVVELLPGERDAVTADATAPGRIALGGAVAGAAASSADADAAAATAVAAAVVGAALLRSLPGARPARDDARAAADVLGFAEPYVDGAARLLATAPVLGRRLDDATLADARVERWLDLVESDDPARHDRGIAAARDGAVDFAAVACIAARYATASPAARVRLATAHRALGRGLRVEDSRAEISIRRATHRGRYDDVDALVRHVLQAMSTGADEAYGIDLGTLRGAIGVRPLVVRDEAVADGTTTVDLARALLPLPEDAFPAVEIDAGDVAAAYTLLRDPRGVVDAAGRCVALLANGLPASARAWSADPAAYAAERAAVEAAYARMTGDERSAATVPWLTPEAADLPPRVRLTYRVRDLFAGEGRAAHVVRAAGVLYERVHPDADSDSYFTADRVREGLRALGRVTVPGGLVVVVNAVDSRDGMRRFLDCDVFQRAAGPPVLEHRLRIGRGTGLADLAIELPSGSSPTQTTVARRASVPGPGRGAAVPGCLVAPLPEGR